jgi:hypothetical protein
MYTSYFETCSELARTRLVIPTTLSWPMNSSTHMSVDAIIVIIDPSPLIIMPMSMTRDLKP